MEVKKSTRTPILVVLGNTEGAPVNGKAAGDMTVRVKKRGEASTVKTLAGGDWVADGGIPGAYDLYLDPADVDVVGAILVYVTTAGAEPFYGVVDVVERLEGETFGEVRSVGDLVLVVS
jgi:hypothetical protein